MPTDIDAYFARHTALMQQTQAALSAAIEATARSLMDALRGGGKLLIFGNGGSAADAQHFAAELVGRYLRERPGLAAVALSTDTSALTAIGNDYGFEKIFQRQVEALARPGDVLVGISTSGHSKNVLLALEEGRRRGCLTVGLGGGTGGEMGEFCDRLLIVPSTETPLVQEAHQLIIHLLCSLVEDGMVQFLTADIGH